VKDGLPLRHEKVGHALEHRQGSRTRQRFLGRRLHDAVADIVLRKKLLRSFAALSAGAVVAPLQGGGHSRLLSYSRSIESSTDIDAGEIAHSS